MSLVWLDGRDLARDETRSCDVAIVGSGPGGATVARELARAGADVVVLEAGPWVQPHEMPADPLESLTRLYDGGGLRFTKGRAPMQLLYGRALGGTSVVNSGICWRLPREVYAEWVARDPALADELPWETLDRAGTEIEDLLGVAPTNHLIAGGNNLLMARGADRLGLSHRPTRRNMAGCQGLARCNAGCPKGAKLSMDRSLLPAATAAGARIVTSVQVQEVMHRGGRARGLTAAAAGGGRLHIEARRAVVLAAGAIGTPLVLLDSRLRGGPVGQYLQCHPGVAVAGRFAEEVRSWEGATQGHEVTGLMEDGIKLEALALDPAFIAHSTGRIGADLTEEMARLSHWATWAAPVRAESLGTVTRARREAKVRLELIGADVERIRRAVAALCDLMFAAGAVEVAPGVVGFDRHLTDPEVTRRFRTDGPLDPRAYSAVISHFFGTCRMGSDPQSSVVGPGFRHHAIDELYIADASVFPTNLGVNPQISIMSMASCCAASMLRS
jgi:choline dehydrogenase-like flavoprotein